MLFNRSKPEQKVRQLISKLLATAFNLSEKQVGSWLTISSHDVLICLPFAAGQLHGALEQQIRAASNEQNVTLGHIVFETAIQASPTKVSKVSKIKNIVAIASGKGGVGKSTTSVNIAYALMAQGAKVGLLDADIYGPSIPIMLGNTESTPASRDDKTIVPFAAHGLVASSIGYFVPAENATVWRGPMASKALEQLLRETDWPELDYLIVDMPPGTGDIQLTLAQQIPVSAAVIVTTPQDLAVADASKGISMFNKVSVPVLGLIENMSLYICPKCGHQEHIFAQNGGVELAKRNNVPLLGQLPLNIKIRQHTDSGTPLLVSEPEDPLSQTYMQCALAISKQLYLNGLSDLRIQNV
ncbi:iron-sulfur cluster carrier protein ApbC [Paraglaciecola polaris]|uniref:Iron-sulfur cluster carrier protein n=1 Tax=Paraglaciecola polaris LMG 21857 TaxID=1129793 RepID=K6YGW4_9ALTE|nr:iron-sulfur cluster carrier protein ApbC [Paraglaciecola polaris]GAC31974.1 ATP-binding protein involved in chromosome partitioning [Paraglaciecola polaris LMG 21857]|tara:strand:- start:3666 stop:4730 length:1065 start_codon:yes stop_codon:yes gene_type:complete